MRASLVGIAVGVVVAAGLVGSMLLVPTAEPGAEPEPQEVAVQATLLQAPEDEHPQLCAVVLESHPPQCSGLDVIGDVDWASVDAEEASGTRWADQVWFVGEPGDAAFTLTQPVGLEEPEGVVVVSVDQLG